MDARLTELKEELEDISKEIHAILDGVPQSTSVVAETLALGLLTDDIEDIVIELKEIDKDRELFEEMVAITELLIMTHRALESRLGELEHSTYKDLVEKMSLDPEFKLSEEEKSFLDTKKVAEQPLQVVVVGVAKPTDPKKFFGRN